MLKLFDFYCKNCDLLWEDLVEDEKSTCKQCNKEVPREKIHLPKIGGFSILDADGKRQSLLKRSAEHTFRELKKEPERFGPEGIRRARDGQIKSFGGLKDK